MQLLKVMVAVGGFSVCLGMGSLLGCSATDNSTGGTGGGSSTGGAGGAGGGAAKVAWCDVYSVMKEKCLGCHTNPDPSEPKAVKLATYADAKTHATHVKDEVNAGTMPPPGSPKLLPAEKQRILDWVDQGAKDEGGTNCK